MLAHGTTQLTEQAHNRLREVQSELRALSARDVDVTTFYAESLAKIDEAIGAESLRIWLNEKSSGWRAIAATGTPELADERRPSDELARLLDDLSRDLKPQLIHEATGGEREAAATVVRYPYECADLVRGAVELRLAVGSEAASRGALRFLGEAIESFRHYHSNSSQRALRRAVERQAAELALSAALHARLAVQATSFALANDGKLLLRCDRLTVLVRRGGSYRIVAASGLERVDRRSGGSRAIERVTSTAVAAADQVEFPSAAARLTNAQMRAFNDYVDQSSAKRLIVAALRSATTAEHADSGDAEAPVGALLVEWFHDAAPQADERECLEAVVRSGACALRNAIEHESLFLFALWRTLGRVRDYCFAPQTRRRAAVTAALVVAAVAALVFVPADDTAYCRGTLQPIERRHVFAPLDGTVKRMAIRHGDRVRQGDVLLELHNSELEMAFVDVEGRRTAAREQLTAVERTLFDESKRLTAEERSRLVGERNQYREQLESLDRQIALHTERRRLLSVRSPIDGEVTTWNAADLLENRPVRSGQRLLTIADVGGDWEAELRVPEDRSGRVTTAAAAGPLRVTFRTATNPDVVLEATVAEIEVAADLHGEDGNTVMVRTKLDAERLPRRRPGAEVFAHIHCGRRSLGYVWFRDVADFVRGSILFRWF